MAKFRAGDKALWRSHAVEIAEISDHIAVVIESTTSDLVQVPPSELRPLPVADAEEIQNTLTRIRKEDWQKASALAAALRLLADSDSDITEAVRAVAREMDVHERTIWRALKRYRDAPLTTALIPRSPGRKRGCRVLDVDRERLIDEAIKSYYLRREKPTLSGLVEEVEAACRGSSLKPPSAQTIAARVNAFDLGERLRRRQGTKAAKAVCKPVPGHVDVTRALERVEIDHTLVDVILRADTADREVIGRPWLTLAICCGTRSTFGFYLSFARPSAASVAMCLAQAALPKAAWLEQQGVAGTWPMEGIPLEIWVDNAREFDSLALRRGCEQYQIALNFRPVGSPEMGGMIERLVGTYMGHCHLLPGTTHSNVIAKGDYDAEARATMTLREFTAWFTEQVVSQYHLNVHRTLGTSPLLAWQSATASGAPKSVAHPLEFLASFLPGEERVLTRTGVEIHCATYWSERMRPWIGRDLKVMVTYHPARIRSVFVRLPDGTITEAQITKHDVPDVSVDEWRRERLHRRSAARTPELLAAKDKGRERNRQRVKEAGAATRKALRAAGVQPSPAAKEVGERPRDTVAQAAQFAFETINL